jgi:hypothetical protein
MKLAHVFMGCPGVIIDELKETGNPKTPGIVSKYSRYGF